MCVTCTDTFSELSLSMSYFENLKFLPGGPGVFSDRSVRNGDSNHCMMLPVASVAGVVASFLK